MEIRCCIYVDRCLSCLFLFHFIFGCVNKVEVALFIEFRHLLSFAYLSLLPGILSKANSKEHGSHLPKHETFRTDNKLLARYNRKNFSLLRQSRWNFKRSSENKSLLIDLDNFSLHPS